MISRPEGEAGRRRGNRLRRGSGPATTLDLVAGPIESFRIDKPTGPVTLRLTGRDTLVMIDPERGELAYRRHSAPL
jgi:hypothetical protein